nr:hypothetical protein [Allobaculum sp. Allo2]
METVSYDVLIIGAGPGGIFAAYELTRLDPTLRIGVLESGAPFPKENVRSTAPPFLPAYAARPARS